MSYHVDLTWDDEAAVWLATSDDVPGLILEMNAIEVKTPSDLNFQMCA